ncbi:MAG: hypothetical protein HPY66_1858 [Firmicutes bacterium]|nr:hypothetical protein [Bacillota bacterium]
MKRIIIPVILSIVLSSTAAYAAAPLDQPGINDETVYQEVVFVTGEPVVVTGSLKVTESARKDYVTSRLTYDLENKEKGMKVKRSITLNTQLDVKEGIKQTVSIITLDRFSETITAADGKYKLEDYILNGSRITHNKPVADFFSGNWQGKKIYSINGDEGRVTIETIGQEIGYSHHWGSVLTRKVDGFIDVKRDRTDADGDEISADWDGEFSYRTSSTVNKYLSYVRNEPSQISFRGSYLLTVEEENLIDYSYDLPEFDDDGYPHRRNRDIDSDSIVLKTVPKYQRLLIPEIKDIGGHWAENDISVLYGLGVFPQTSAYFGPSLPMLRSDFARAIVEATNLLTETAAKTTARNQPAQAEVFQDVSTTHRDYKYIVEVEKRGIITGVGPGQFLPDGKLTRAQAITIIMRALGFDNMAPTPGYSTGFADDSKIPAWAKDSIYAAREIGLVQGDSYGYVHPDEVMTRAEAAAFLYRFIRYLQNDIKKDYRDRILYY